MTRHILSSVTFLSIHLLQASAQLLSCTSVGCPRNDFGAARCNIDGTTLTELGVANFTSSLSPDPLSWTIGYAPSSSDNTTDQRRYYLGTPQGLDLSTRTDVTGCALFFTGIEAGLSFVKPNGTTLDLNAISGTCADALGSTCVVDLTNQARALVTTSIALGNLSCSKIEQALLSSPPLSCTAAGTWGSITAKSIAGPNSPAAEQKGSCTPTFNQTYDIRSVATFSRIGDSPFGSYITPLMTILAATHNETDVLVEPEVNLNCMMPLEDLPANQMVPTGSGARLTARGTLSYSLWAPIGLLTVGMFLM